MTIPIPSGARVWLATGKTSSYWPQRDYHAIQAASFDEISLNGCAPILGGRSANAALLEIGGASQKKIRPMVCGDTLRQKSRH